MHRQTAGHRSNAFVRTHRGRNQQQTLRYPLPAGSKGLMTASASTFARRGYHGCLAKADVDVDVERSA